MDEFTAPPLPTGPQLSGASLRAVPAASQPMTSRSAPGSEVEGLSPSHKPAHETVLPGKAADRRRPRPVPSWAGAPQAAWRPLPAQQVGRRASPILPSWTLWQEATW